MRILKNYNHLKYEDRLFIEESLKKGISITEIAYKLNRSLQTIYAELKRGDTGEVNKLYEKEYSAELGQKTYMKRKRRCGRKANYVTEKWSE